MRKSILLSADLRLAPALHGGRKRRRVISELGCFDPEQRRRTFDLLPLASGSDHFHLYIHPHTKHFLIYFWGLMAVPPLPGESQTSPELSARSFPSVPVPPRPSPCPLLCRRILPRNFLHKFIIIFFSHPCFSGGPSFAWQVAWPVSSSPALHPFPNENAHPGRRWSVFNFCLYVIE